MSVGFGFGYVGDEPKNLGSNLRLTLGAVGSLPVAVAGAHVVAARERGGGGRRGGGVRRGRMRRRGGCFGWAKNR